MNRIYRFTLIEVIVSIMILALGLGGTLGLLMNSQVNIARAETQWREMHMLTQGAEYLLLAGTADNLYVPDEFFPYRPDYQLECEIEAADDLPEEYTDLSGQLPLTKWTITLYDGRENRRCSQIIIDKIDYSDSESSDEQQ